jgi:putative transposase
MCQVLGVSVSGYYASRHRNPSRRGLFNQAVLLQIRAIHQESRRTYGSPRIQAELRARGLSCNIKRVVRLMRLNHIQARHKRQYRTTTQRDHLLPVAPNRLDRKFQADGPNEKWLTDVTAIPTHEGWLYLAAVLDMYSRRVLGWAMASENDSMLVSDALRMALGRRTPAPGILHHSDRGRPYAGGAYQQLLNDHGFTVSMSGAGNCYDNAPMESFFGTLKAECVHWQRYRTRDEARQDIVRYIESWYNSRRRHSALGYQSPNDFENARPMS